MRLDGLRDRAWCCLSRRRLVYGQRIGVTHADANSQGVYAGFASAALADNTMVRARAGDADVLLVRQLDGYVRSFMRVGTSEVPCLRAR